MGRGVIGKLIIDSNGLIIDSNRLIIDSNRLIIDSNRLIIDRVMIGRLIITLLISVHFLILNTSAASAARLPSVGSDSNAWGNLLNEFLLISHTANGTLIKGLNASFDTLNISQNLIVLGNISGGILSGEIPDSFKNSNWTALYNNEASTRFSEANFTSLYDTRSDRWQLANFTTAFANRLSELWNLVNFTRAYANEYAVSGYKKANLTIDYPNLDTDSTNDITTSDSGTVTNTMLSGSIALSKLASGSSAQIIVAGSSGVPAYATMSGDATVSNSGVLTIESGAITGPKIGVNSVTTSKINDGSVETQDIKDNDITTTDLAGNLTFASTDLVDLGSVTHDDTTIRGLRIPVSSGTPATLTGTPEGHIAWDSANNVLYLSADGGWATFFNNTANPNTWTNTNNFSVGVVIGNGTQINRHLSATGTVGNGGNTITQNGCISDTITVTGAASGDTVIATPPSNIENNMLWSAYVSAANTVTVTLCRFTSASSSADLTWRIDVWKH